MFGTLADVKDGRNLPVGHFLRRRHFTRFTLHRLTYRQRNARAGPEHPLTQTSTAS